MSIELTPVRQVKAQYGPRTTAEARSGNVQAFGVVRELQIDIRGGEDFQFVEGLIPDGSVFLDSTATVEEAFVVTGTTPVLYIGTDGSADTNYGATLTEAQLEAAGTTIFLDTGAGTWGSPLTADTAVAVELGGTTPALAEGAGLLRVVIRYVYVG